MTQLILAGIGLAIWAMFIIITYYSTFYSSVAHTESATGFWGYLALMGIIYACYKVYTVFIAPKKEFKIGFFTILGGILLHLLIICGFYSSFTEVLQSPFMNGMKPASLILFFHILSLLIYPLVLTLLVRSAGFSVMSRLPLEWKNEDMRIRVPAEISIGFLIFSTILLILAGIFGFTLTVLCVTMVLLGIIAIPGLIETYKDIRTRTITLQNHDINGSFIEAMNLKLLSIEFAVFFLTFILSVSLINVLRPMPIGWDDLGVYMNFPKIMATSGELLKGAGFYVWQLITGTGFLFSYTAAQAFYINQLGGILAVIAIICSLSYIFEEKNKKSFLSLPILLAAVFYVMPMTVFQQAKDMKLDPALMFFSISAFTVLFSLWKKSDTKKRSLTIICLAGILTGFAFWVKVTTLMLLLGALGLIAYRFLSIGGYLGFFFLFLSIFTGGNLWIKLNVTMPSDPTLIHWITIVSGVLGLGCIAWGILEKKKEGIAVLESWLTVSLVFIVSFALGLSPWMFKNYTETKNISIDSLLGGSWGTTPYNYSQFYTKEEFQKIQESLTNAVTSSGQTQNEDFGRYFGYDSGINNYLKLPANLTFQKNQNGEFTEITYIFLALVPAILLFVRSRKWVFGVLSLGILLLMVLYYFIPGTRTSITALFDSIWLEKWVGYAIMIAMNLAYLTFVHYSFEKTETNEKLKEILMFMGVYGFIFMISAFGIVWYGIVVYFGFFAIIGLGATLFNNYTPGEEKNEDLISVKLTLAVIFFILIGVYFLRSVFPHGWNNLRSAYYNEYKYNVLSQDEAIFAYRWDYVTPIATMNLRSPQSIVQKIQELPLSDNLKKLFRENGDKMTLSDVHQVILKLRTQDNAGLKKDAKTIGNFIYPKILYPSDAESNTGGIYRIGTFMTYLIDNNRKRYFDDSLVTGFSNYIYTPNPEETIERMRKMGLKYLLVDLNAATIDKDPRHDLTNRFERLLLTMRAKNLKLIDTDNKCLELALDEYKSGRLQDETSYINIAGTNYESYRSGTTIWRNQKLYNCHQLIVSKLNGSGTLSTDLESLKQAIVANKINENPEKLSEILASYAGQSWFALFEISDEPLPSVSNITSVTASGNTSSTGTQN